MQSPPPLITAAHDALLSHLEGVKFAGIFPPAAVSAGTKMYRQGRVELVEPLADGGISAIVRGKNGHRYEVFAGEEGELDSLLCTCPRGEECEHAVAAVLKVRSVAGSWRRILARLAAAAPPAKAPPTTKTPPPPAKTPPKKSVASAPPADAGAPPRDAPALRAWATAHGVADLLGELDNGFIDYVYAHAPSQLDLALRILKHRVTLVDLVSTERVGVPTSKTLRELALSYLGRHAAARAAHLAAVRKRRWPPASDPRLAPYVASLLALRSELLAAGVAPRTNDERPHVDVEVSYYPAEVRVISESTHRWRAAARALTVRLRDDGTVAVWPGARDSEACEAIEQALHVLTSSDNAAISKRLADELAVTPWQRLVDRLSMAVAPPDAARANDPWELGWRLALRGAEGGAAVIPVECRPKARGGYKTKQIATATWRTDEPPGAHPADAAVFSVLRLDRDFFTDSSPNHEATLGVALSALVGHPRFFVRDGSDAHVALRRGHLALATRDRDGGFEVGFELDGAFHSAELIGAALRRVEIDGQLLLVAADGATATLCALSPALAGAITVAAQHQGTLLPAEAAKPFVAVALKARDRLPLALSEGLRGPNVAADPRVHVRLALGPEGLTVAAITKPAVELASEIPGEGPTPLYVERAGALVAVTRDLVAERAAADRLWRELRLAPADAFTDVLPLGDRALDLVRALTDRGDLPVEWGSAERVTVASPVGFDALKLEARSGKGKSWFSMHGMATIAGGGVVPLAELLRAIRERQRYVRVDDGRWAEIDQAVARRMGAIAKRGGQVPALMAPLVAELEDAGAELRGFKQLHASLERLRQARGLVVVTPGELQADLRPYQQEGFVWLARLAAWAPGACLADDMGLGKTVQALAFLLHRSKIGPALVVAPTSLGFNWVREAEKFAPSLRLHAVRSGAELAALGDLGAGDVVVTSYGLVALHVARLKEVGWGTLVVDEAQTVKNAATKRAQALRQVAAGFCLALTGTPVENRASELWSLFRLIAPGLLGSEATFREEFAAPIERGDEVARAGLAALITPFVLRRLKRDVARDLPPRTEVQLEVVLKKAERERYEKIRQATLRLLDGEDGTPALERRFKALQALTRLRQLACHPGLVDPSWTGGSAKLDAVTDVLTRLREEGHRALVFSQFTSFLTRVRDRLEESGVSTLYLDGQTSPKERQVRVDAFQAGTADAFLLSLKAGGTGLNLTAATYVIHLDPWWNPAVEDQATDRTHRIGQDQPVTVYRMVAKDTVEEGIVKLHGDKRELADALLAGTGSSATLSYEEMLALISGAVTPDMLVDDDDDDDDDGDAAPAAVIDLAAARERRASSQAALPAPAPAQAPTEAPTEAAPAVTAPEDLEARFVAALAASKAGGEISSSTAASYRSAGKRFIAFASGRGLDPAATDALDAYLAGVADGSIAGGKSAIGATRAAFKWILRVRDGG